MHRHPATLKTLAIALYKLLLHVLTTGQSDLTLVTTLQDADLLMRAIGKGGRALVGAVLSSSFSRTDARPPKHKYTHSSTSHHNSKNKQHPPPKNNKPGVENFLESIGQHKADWLKQTVIYCNHARPALRGAARGG